MTLVELIQKPQSIFVTGTDTDVGKTWFCCRLLEVWKRRSYDVGALKPITCGSYEDGENLLEACKEEGLELERVSPFLLRMPAAPFAASQMENHWPDVDELAHLARSRAENYDGFLVEGVGGWEVPITEKVMCSDFAEKIGFPILVVANNRLGALNHTILTVQAIRAKGLTCMGVVLNQVQEERDSASLMNKRVLDQVLGEGTVLGEILHDEDRLENVE